MGDSYEVVIKPNRSWFYIDWRSLVYYRDLLFFLVRRDFISKYKQTILGPTWFVVQPLATTLVFTVVFGKVAKISTDGLPPILFYLCGLLIWRYFASCMSSISTTLTSNARLFEKVYFPRLIIPLAVIVSNLLASAIQLVMFLGFYFYFKYFTQLGVHINPNIYILMLPLMLLQVMAISMGVGLWISALSVKYHDFAFLTGFLTQLWMYATPIIYPMSIIPEKYRIFMALNPMSSVVEFFRYAFFGTGTINLSYSLISIGTTLFLLITGVMVFNRAERTFIDTV